MKKLIATVTILITLSSEACPDHLRDLIFTESKILIPLKGSKVTVAYGLIKNISKEKLELKIIEADGFRSAEIHESYQEGGKAGMRKIDTIEIPSEKTFELKSGSFHVMLFDPTKTFKPGDEVRIKFLKNGNEIVEKYEISSRR